MQLLAFVFSYLGSFYAAFVYHRAFAFVGYLMVYFFYPFGGFRWWSYSLPSIPYSFTTTALMISVYLMNFSESNKNKILACPQMVCAWVLALYYFFVNIFAIRPDLHMMFSVLFLKTMITVTVAYKLIDKDKMLNIVLFAYIFGAAFVGLLVKQVGRNSGPNWDRVAGVDLVDNPDTNGVAAVIAPAAICALYWFWIDSRLKMRVPMIIAGALVVNAVVLINSRGSFLGVIGGSSYFIFNLYFSKFRRKGQRLGVMILIALGLVAVFNVVDQSTIERFYTISEEAEVDEEQEGGGTRMFFWVAAYEMSKDYPFGMGKLGFNKFADEYLPQDLNTGGNRARSIHSTWFQTLNEAGYPGLILFILMHFFCFRTLSACQRVAVENNDIPNYYKCVAIKSMFVSYMIASTFLDLMTANFGYWLVLFSACVYNLHVLKEKRPDR